MIVVVWLLAALAIAAPAVPIAIDPIRARCFDSEKLASEIRARLEDAEVSIGRAPRRAHIEVRVEQGSASIAVHVIIRDASGRIAGKDFRRLPDDGECPAILEAAAMIVVRAATPMTAGHVALAKPEPGSNRPSSPPTPSAPPVQRSSEPSPATEPSAAPAPVTVARSRSPEPAPVTTTTPPDTVVERRQPGPVLTAPRVAARSEPPTNPLPAALVAAPAPPTERRKLEFELGGGFLVGIDQSISVAAGEIAMGLAGPRFGVAVRAGVSDQWTASAQSPVGMIAIDVQRIPIGAEVHLDVPFDRDAIRLAAGAGVILARAASEGLPKTDVATVAEPDVFFRASYRLGIHRMFLSFGVALDVAFIHDDLAIQGVGVLVRTPALEVVPFANLGFAL